MFSRSYFNQFLCIIVIAKGLQKQKHSSLSLKWRGFVQFPFVVHLQLVEIIGSALKTFDCNNKTSSSAYSSIYTLLSFALYLPTKVLARSACFAIWPQFVAL